MHSRMIDAPVFVQIYNELENPENTEVFVYKMVIISSSAINKGCHDYLFCIISITHK